MRQQLVRLALRTSLIYGLFAALWILLSDRVLALSVADPDLREQLQTYKGWVFVAFTMVLLYSLLRRQLMRWEHLVAEREQAEAALKKSEEQLRQAVAVAGLGLFEDDHVNDVLHWSALEHDMHRLDRAAQPNLKEGLQRVHPDDRERHVAAIQRAHDPRGDGVFLSEYRIVLADGSIRWLVSRSQTFFEGEGAARRPVRTIGAEQDITAQKQAELQIRQLNEDLEQRVAQRTAELADANARLSELVAVKDNLLAIASHDLRSPLGAILNTAELLIEDDELPSDMRQRMLENIYSSAQFLIEMVTKLLDLSRLEAGKVEMEPSRLLVSEIARQSLASLQAHAEAKTIATELVVDPGELPVYADSTKLMQILNNLLSNAIKFTPAGGHVTVAIGPDPDGVCVSVADTGMGIPTEGLPHVFEKFRQIHRRGTADERGSGLGLAIVRQLVDLHGGSIEVSSTVNGGSTFTVHLPSRAPERSLSNGAAG